MTQITVTAAMVLQNYQLLKAEQERRLPLRLALLGLLNCCDKNGVFYWRPQQLKLRILPYEEIDFTKVLEALVESRFIGKYVEQGQVYGFVLQTVLANWV